MSDDTLEVIEYVTHGESSDSITATPAIGYKFTGWTGDSASISNPLSLENVTSDMTVQANFELKKFKVTFIAGANGKVDNKDTVVQTVDYGNDCEKTLANPATEYSFTKWKWTGEDLESSENPLTVKNVTSDIIITASFSDNSHKVTFKAGDNGKVGDDTLEVVEHVTHGENSDSIIATPAIGYNFTGWTGDSASISNPLSLENVTSDMTVQANFELKKLKVTFIAGTNGKVDLKDTIVQTVDYGQNCEKVQANPATGYHFMGWTGDITTSINPLEINFVTVDKEATAIFAQDSFTVSFNSQGGGEVPEQTIEYGKLVEEPTAPIFTGHSLVDWFKEEARVTIWDFSTDTVTSELTLYAKWIANGYSLTFDKNNAQATGSMADQIIANGSTAKLTSNQFTKAGWSFAGWAISSTGEVEYADEERYTMGTPGDTLYALWTVNDYTITFDKNDELATNTMADQTIVSGLTAALIANNFAKPNWRFEGWAETAGGSVRYTDEESYTMGTSNDTLYAKWTTNGYNITFNKNDNDAEGTMSSQTIVYLQTRFLKTNNFTKLGWSFDGWAETPSGPVKYTDREYYTMDSPADIQLYAVWTVNDYTITFDPNGEIGTMAPQIMTFGSEGPLNINSYTKPNWSFAGWATSSTGEVVYADKASYTMGASDDTLYATWTINDYTITFDENGGTGTMSPQIMTFESEGPLNNNSFNRTGWSFAGWAETSSGPVAYTDGQVYTMGASDDTLYAAWTVDNYSITFDPNGGAGSIMSPQTMDFGSQEPLNVNTYTRTSWKFNGWAETSRGPIAYHRWPSLQNGRFRRYIIRHMDYK